jgi:hypothetical protein
MSHEWHLVARREELHLHVVVARFGFQHECGLAVHFGGNHLHLFFGQIIGVQHHDGGIPRIALARERIDVKQPATTVGHEALLRNSWRLGALIAPEVTGD